MTKKDKNYGITTQVVDGKVVYQTPRGIFVVGEKVVFNRKTYDFGCAGRSGKAIQAIIYEEGENNIQDSMIVDLKQIKHKTKESKLVKKTEYHIVGPECMSRK